VIEVKIDRKNKRAYMSPFEVRLFWEAADQETELLTKLMARSSPRIGKAVETRPGDIYVPENENVVISVLKIRKAKDTTEDGSGKDRISWVPKPLHEEIKDYCERKGISDDEELVKGGKSKFQKSIRNTREELATRTGDPDWLFVTSHDFRIFFATNSVRRLNLPLELVMYMGDWDSQAAIEPYLEERLPIDIQNELLDAEPYDFLDQEVPVVEIQEQYDRADEPDYDMSKARLSDFADD
jgi:integrase